LPIIFYEKCTSKEKCFQYNIEKCYSIVQGHVTRCNSSCNLQCNSTLERC
jgi:hypothetical protein